MKKPINFLCIHGFGVRGFFWNTFAKLASARKHGVVAPDFSFPNIDGSIAEIAKFIQGEVSPNHDCRTIVIGHSLGGILSALALRAQPIQPPPLLVVLSTPYGAMMKGSLNPVLRLLFRWNLIPRPLIRRRFFGKSIASRLQKELFALAVPESPEMKALLKSDQWFHNERLKTGSPLYGYAIAFPGDRIVNPEQTKAFAVAAGLEFRSWETAWGHDDLAVSEDLCREFLDYLELSDYPGNHDDVGQISGTAS